MKSNLRIYHKNDSAIILGAYMQYDMQYDSVQDRNFVVLWDGLDRCDIGYPFYAVSIETLILHSFFSWARSRI